MIYNRLTNSILVLLFSISLTSLFGQDQAAIEAGKTLFKNKCASCHNKDMKSKMTGPALGGAQERWGDDVALYSWIRNSAAMVSKGHPRAVAIFNEFNKGVMTAFPELTDADIANIIGYINCTAAGNCPGDTPPPPTDGGGHHCS